jgi:hypothetical protein
VITEYNFESNLSHMSFCVVSATCVKLFSEDVYSIFCDSLCKKLIFLQNCFAFYWKIWTCEVSAISVPHVSMDKGKFVPVFN